jgi:hypothetical protein
MEAVAWHVPTHRSVVGNKSRDDYDMRRIWQMVSGVRKICRYSGIPLMAALEAQRGFKGEGPTALLSIGMGFGMWRMALTAAEIPFIEVYPHEWRLKYLPPGSDKQAARSLAIKLFPAVEFPLVKDEARAEALLIADYALRKDLGLGFLRNASKSGKKSRQE